MTAFRDQMFEVFCTFLKSETFWWQNCAIREITSINTVGCSTNFAGKIELVEFEIL